MAMADVTERHPEADLVLDDELLYEDAPRRSSMLRRSEDRVEQIVREGEVLAGKYRVERIPGRRGLGVLVQVRHMELGQEVTLKFLVPDACAYPEFVQRFVREARAAVKIQGEHVARVTDVGRLDSGAPYMVREFLRGPDLAEVIKVRGALPIEEAVDYVIQACEGVAEGHALGVIHRNLRPTSLVVTRRSDGTPLVKVFDFAAAESLHVDPFTERSVSLVGTSAIMASLPYLSPEQIRDPHDVDVRADVYSLGAVLFELLTGGAVYSADSAPALLASVAADAAPALRNLRPDVPGELDHIVLRCLSKNRALRYSSVAELAQALKPFASVEASGSIEHIARLAKRSRPPELGLARPSSPASMAAPPLAPASPSPFTPNPSAAPAPPPGRGPTGTLMLQMTETSRASAAPHVAHVGNDDVTTINPYSTYVPPVVSPPAPREASRYTPQPPPLRSSVPPPLRAPTPLPPPVSAPPPLPGAAPSARMPTSLPPPRSSMSGLTRSWAVSDGPAAPLFTRNRLIAIGAIAACATLGGVLALRNVPAQPAAAAQPARVQAPPRAPAPAPSPAPSPEPVASAVTSAAPAGALAQSAVPPAPVAPPVAAAPAPAPVATPAQVAPKAAAPAPVVARRPAPKPKAEDDGAAVAKGAATEKVARAKPAAGPDLFGDTN